MANITNKNIQTDKYVGIPYLVNGRDFSGIDCYGLVRLVYKEELGIDLPSFAEEGINPERTQELIAQYKEGWEPTDTIEAGDVVIFKVMGVDAHIAVAVSSTHFLHARQGYNSAIESFDSPKWKTRKVGAYKYSPKKSVVLNGIPHPLRTERITTAIPAGTNVVQLEQWILKEYQIDDKLHPYVKVLVNSIPIPDEMKVSTVIQDNDVVEYRVVPQGGGDNFLRTVLTIAVVVAAPQLIASLGTIGGVSVAAGTFAGGLATMALTAVGLALVDAIAPVRMPSMPSMGAGPENPQSAEAQIMVTGGANRASPYEPIPFVLGRVRMTPPLGASSYYMFTGERDTALRMLLTWGYGPLYVDENSFRIGKIPLSASNFPGVHQQTLSRITEPTTYQLDNFNNIYGSDTTQVPHNVELTCDGPAGAVSTSQYSTTVLTGSEFFPASFTYTLPAGYVVGSASAYAKQTGWMGTYNEPLEVSVSGLTATISPSTRYQNPEFIYYYDIYISYKYSGPASPPAPGPWVDSSSTDGAVGNFTVAIHFPQGCRKIASKGENAGKSYPAPVYFELESKPASAVSWTTYGYLVVGAQVKKDAFTFTRTFTSNVNEDLQVRVRRITGTGTGEAADENYQWLFQSTLLNVTFARNAKPTLDPVGCKIAKTAFQILASKEFNGQIEGINGIVQTWGKSWNGTAWVDGAINNPAALFRHVLEHPANPRRVTDAASKINLTQLQYWHEYCTAKGFTFNSVIASTRSVLDILRDICAAGRASPAMIDGKWTVIIDEPKSNVVQHFSPHNSWGFEGVKSLPQMPDGLRVNFINEDDDFQQAETIVYAPGKTAATASLLETISVPGVTKLAQAQDHARWHMAQAKLRPETYTLNTDIEYIVCNRGDRVKVMHDVAMWGLGSGRIKNKISDTVIELTETIPIDFASNYSIRFRSKTGGSTDRVIQKTFTPTFASRTSNVVTVTSAGHPLSVGDSVSVSMTGVSLNTSIADITAVTTDTFSYILAGSNVSNTAVTGTINLNDGYYSKIKITVAADTTLADNDDLFLFGLVNQESQDCVVLSIEPTNNKSARITLVDYGITPTYNIFTDYLNYTSALAFESQITLPPKLIIPSFDTKVPTITGFISDERVMDRIAAGVFAYKMRVSYTNATALPSTTSFVEFQWDYSTVEEGDFLGTRSKQVAYNLGSVTITDVDEGEVLKVRCRYVGSDGRTGQWAAWQNHTIVGKTNPPSAVTTLSATPDVTTGKLSLKWSQNLEVDLKGYEVRTDTLWGNVVNQVFLGDATSCLAAPAIVGSSVTFYIKAIDYSDNYSTIATSTSYTTTAVPNVVSVVHSFYDTSTTSATVTIDWVDVTPTFGLKGYEITYGSNTKVINGSFLTVPADWVGVRAFVIKTIDLNGQKSTGFTYNVTKLEPSAVVSASFTIDQATVLLDWPDAVKTTLPIWGYEVRTDTNFGTAGFVFKGSASNCRITGPSTGANTFYIKSIDTDNVYSSTYFTASFTVNAPPDVTAVTHVFTDTSLTAATITLDWNDVSPQFKLAQYEISYDAVVKYVTASTITLPANWLGERTFTIKSVDALGNKSAGFAKVVNKLAPNPVTNFRAQVIDNTVMFYWDLPAKTSLPIDHVLLKKGAVGSTWATASLIGPKSGGFTTQNETTGGNYVYYVAAVDTDGNESTPVSITTSVAQPPDFVFFANYESTFSGTKSSAVNEVNSTSLIMPVNTTQTFQDHFITNSWSTPQDQITAGYPVYIQPSNGTGYYEETFDYGTLLSSSKVTLVINGVTVAGTVTIVPMVSVSANGSTWVDYAGTYEVFATSFRYVKVRVTATASTGTGVYSLNSLNVSLESKLLNDAGNVSCLSTDTLGTIVNFNKEFVDVTSITVSPAGTTAIIPVYDFVDSVGSGTYSITTNVCTVTSTAHGLITGQKVRLGFVSGTAPSAVYTITGYTANTFTCSITTANTSGSVSTYPESFRLYLFNTAGTRVSATASWSLKGY